MHGRVRTAAQDDYALGEPDWTEVVDRTALDLRQLLPSRGEVLALIVRAAGELGGRGGDDEMEQLLKEAEGDGSDGTPGASHGAPGDPNYADTLSPGALRDAALESAMGAASATSGRAASDPKRIADATKGMGDDDSGRGDAALSALEGDSADAEEAARRRKAQASRAAELHDAVVSADKLLRIFQARDAACSRRRCGLVCRATKRQRSLGPCAACAKAEFGGLGLAPTLLAAR